MLKYSFSPVINENCKVIILGSLPSVKSLEKREYYGNPRNHFWPIMYRLFNTPFEQDYQKRLKFLLCHNIALFDVIKSARNINSLDTNIKDEKPNDFPALFLEYPNISHIFFNGTKAKSIFKKHFPGISINYTLLCSSSPIPTRVYKTVEDKLPVWRLILSSLI